MLLVRVIALSGLLQKKESNIFMMDSYWHYIGAPLSSWSIRCHRCDISGWSWWWSCSSSYADKKSRDSNKSLQEFFALQFSGSYSTSDRHPVWQIYSMYPYIDSIYHMHNLTCLGSTVYFKGENDEDKQVLIARSSLAKVWIHHYSSIYPYIMRYYSKSLPCY